MYQGHAITTMSQLTAASLLFLIIVSSNSVSRPFCHHFSFSSLFFPTSANLDLLCIYVAIFALKLALLRYIETSHPNIPSRMIKSCWNSESCSPFFQFFLLIFYYYNWLVLNKHHVV